MTNVSFYSNSATSKNLNLWLVKTLFIAALFILTGNTQVAAQMPVTAGIHSINDDEIEFDAPYTNLHVSITYEVQTAGNVRLYLYDTNGGPAQAIISGNQSTGTYTVEWETTNRPSGEYLFNLTVDGAEPSNSALVTRS